MHKSYPGKVDEEKDKQHSQKGKESSTIPRQKGGPCEKGQSDNEMRLWLHYNPGGDYRGEKGPQIYPDSILRDRGRVKK